jgi:sigma-B regulation protein RsbU (phosphoserine phosphatase)
VGDVTGKGMRAALLMLMAKSCLYNQVERDPSTLAVMNALNRLLLGLSDRNQMMTCFYCIYDPAQSKLIYSNAGHNFPYHFRRDTRRAYLLEESGLPLGAVADAEYEERSVTIEQGDQVYIYSDGIVEAQDRSGTLYGFPRLEQAIGRAARFQPREAVAMLVQEAKGFQGDALQSDDMTLVVLQATGNAARMVSSVQTRWQGNPIELRLPSQLGAERAAMAAAAAVAHSMGFLPRRIDDVRTVVAEACVNAAEHGNRLRPDAVIHVAIQAADGQLIITVSDSGPGFTRAGGRPDIAAALRGESGGRGWGLYLMERLADGVEYGEAAGGGAAVRLTFNAVGGPHE